MLYKCKKCKEEFNDKGLLGNHVRKFHSQLEKIDFSKICSKQTIPIENLKSIIEDMFINKETKNIQGSPYIDFYINNGTVSILENILYYTSFLDIKMKIKDRVVFILNNTFGFNKCKCGNNIEKFNTKKLLLTFNLYCCQKCANRYTNYEKPKEHYEKIGQKNSVKRKGIKFTDEWKKKLKSSAQKEEVKKKKATSNLKKYGISNPGVLGAYSSKAACDYIKKFLIENDIPENMAYYKNGGINNREYFICYSYNNKKIYYSYDLVVIDKEKNINLVLEYNGPWHYKLSEIEKNPNDPATPYPNSKTKIETYIFDKNKLDIMLERTNNIIIYWEKTKQLTKYEGEL